MMIDWAAWAPTGIAALSCAGMLGVWRQQLQSQKESHKDLKATVVQIDDRNRQDHQILFNKIDEERKEREAAILDIRNNYVTINQCKLLLHANPSNGKAARMGGGI